MDDVGDDLASILSFLPICRRSSTIFWPPLMVEFLTSMARGPIHSKVNSGQILSLAISDLRRSLHLPSRYNLRLGLALYFDDLMSQDTAEHWFNEVMPQLGKLLLRLPELIETHYQNAVIFNGMKTTLRILESQEPGIVFLSQELTASLLVCALFGLFPTTNRGAKHLPTINFDSLFECLYESFDSKLENKVKCIIHYFERVCLHMPRGNISFERKVLSHRSKWSTIEYPKADFWRMSSASLCKLEVYNSGSIEDQSTDALEVDFANRYIGGGALGRGCVQEEIRFMINPELIIGMLFLPSMADNESIEIIGAERYSNYSGYAASFRFAGDHVDKRNIDSFRRRKTRIIAIDALYVPGERQYKPECLLREVNKAFCGFSDQNKKKLYQKQLEENGVSAVKHDLYTNNPSTSSQSDKPQSHQTRIIDVKDIPRENIGIATGNWGCGAFGGDAEVKVVIQWLAASQALRPFILYHTFGLKQLRKLAFIAQWIVSHEWTVSELWNMLIDYSNQRYKGETDCGFFIWLLPFLHDDDDDDDPMLVD